MTAAYEQLPCSAAAGQCYADCTASASWQQLTRSSSQIPFDKHAVSWERGDAPAGRHSSDASLLHPLHPPTASWSRRWTSWPAARSASWRAPPRRRTRCQRRVVSSLWLLPALYVGGQAHCQLPPGRRTPGSRAARRLLQCPCTVLSLHRLVCELRTPHASHVTLCCTAGRSRSCPCPPCLLATGGQRHDEFPAVIRGRNLRGGTAVVPAVAPALAPPGAPHWDWRSTADQPILTFCVQPSMDHVLL